MWFILIVLFLMIIISNSNLKSRLEKIEKKIEHLSVSDNPSDVPQKKESRNIVQSNKNQTQTYTQDIPHKYSDPTKQETPIPANPSVNPEIYSDKDQTGRILGKIGITALVIGIGFFLKYAIDNDWINEWGQIILATMIGLLLVGLGVFYKSRNDEKKSLSDLLTGGGVAILYFAVIAGFFFYELFTVSIAFIFSFIITTLSVYLSIYFKSQAVMVVSLLGGFLSPIMLYKSDVNIVLMHSYIILLMLGVLGVSFRFNWSIASFLSYFFGFIVNYAVWGNHINSTDLSNFVFVSFGSFIHILAILANPLSEKKVSSGESHASLFVVTFIYSILSYGLLSDDYEPYLGLVSFITAIFFGVLSLIAHQRIPQDRSINIILPGIAVAFLSIIVPLEFDGSWVPVFWLVEALVLYVVAAKDSNRGYQIMGAVVYVLGMISFLFSLVDKNIMNVTPVLNNVTVVLMLASLVSFAISYLYKRYGSITKEIADLGFNTFSVLGNIYVLIIGTYEIANIYDGNVASTWISIWWALYAIILTVIGVYSNSSGLKKAGLFLFIITAVKIFFDVWELGPMYRIVVSIIFGIIALSASYIYATKSRK